MGGSSVAAGLPQAAATRKPRARRKTGICNSLLLIMGWGYYSPVGGGDGGSRQGAPSACLRRSDGQKGGKYGIQVGDDGNGYKEYDHCDGRAR